MLFPSQIFNVLKNANIDNNLSHFIKKYNDTLIKLRSLELELIKLKKFGIIIDSEYVWNISINWNVGNSMNLHKEILFFCARNGAIEKWNFSQCQLDFRKINKFMLIYKREDNKYIFKNNGKEEEFPTEKIIALLPINRKLNINKSNINKLEYVVISSVKELDETNKLPALLTNNQARLLDNFSPVLNLVLNPVLNPNSSAVSNARANSKPNSKPNSRYKKNNI